MGAHTQVVRLGTGDGENTLLVSEENPIPVSLASVVFTGPVTLDAGTKVTAVPALGAGGLGLIGWLSQIWSVLAGTLNVSGPLTDTQLRAAAVATKPAQVTAVALLTAVTAIGASVVAANFAGMKTYQANGTTTADAGAATVLVQGSNNGGVTWDTIGTITLTLGTAATSDSFSSNDRYATIRGNVTAISGTGASVNLTMGY